ncbi:hypothetical protein ACFL1G_07365 [Planctomycetota bacterium]
MCTGMLFVGPMLYLTVPVYYVPAEKQANSCAYQQIYEGVLCNERHFPLQIRPPPFFAVKEAVNC